MIGIVDNACGNLRSLEHALERLGRPCRRVAAPGALAEVDRIILPGVGHYAHAMGQLRARGLEEGLRTFQAAGGPLLGICLGMQMLFQGSEEAPGVPGLGFYPGRFRAFGEGAPKVPHMGWSPVDFLGRDWPFYFVHSYFLPEWEGPAADLGWAAHGAPFVAAFRAGRSGGFQFHPEKSGTHGLELLEEALAW